MIDTLSVRIVEPMGGDEPMDIGPDNPIVIHEATDAAHTSAAIVRQMVTAFINAVEDDQNAELLNSLAVDVARHIWQDNDDERERITAAMYLLASFGSLSVRLLSTLAGLVSDTLDTDEALTASDVWPTIIKNIEKDQAPYLAVDDDGVN